MGARRCCCSCAWLFDNFDRVGATDPDGVNVPGATVYSFTPGDWSIVNASGGWATGGVLQSAGGAAIAFLTKAASVEVTVGNFGIGSTAKLSSGGHYVELTGVDDGLGHVRIDYDFDGDVYEEPWDGISGSVRSVELALLFAKPAGNDELIFGYYPPPEDGMMRGPQCRDVALDVAAETWAWTLEASSGVEFDELYAVKLRADCTEFATSCHHTCLEDNPETIEITVGGMQDTMSDCQDGERAECIADSALQDADCVAAATDCAERCACANEKKARDCACNNAHTLPGRSCPKLNGTFVLDRQDNGQKCAGPCYYRGVAPLEPLWDGAADVAGSCQNNLAVETEIGAELSTVYYDATTKRRIVKIEPLLPLTKLDDTPISWSTGNVPAESFCESEVLTVTASETLYADACKLVYRDASGSLGDPLLSTCEHAPGPVGPNCGDATECPTDDEIVPCGDTIEVNPQLARPSHDPITVDDLTAV